MQRTQVLPAGDEYVPAFYVSFSSSFASLNSLPCAQSEVVLSLLIEAFVFAPGDQEIEWLKSGIQVPIVKGQKDLMPRMPMKVTFA